jgi:hypothetical protein
MCEICDDHRAVHAPKGYSESKVLEEGREEAERFGKKLDAPLDQRIIDEVKDYNERYGIASPADVATEINSRGKDIQFQGELYAYAYQDLDRIHKRMDELVRAGRLKKVKVKGAQPGYVVWHTGRRGRNGRRVRYSTKPKAIVDLSPSDL